MNTEGAFSDCVKTRLSAKPVETMPAIERWQALLLMGFVQGKERSQGALLPVSLDELIPEDHLARVIDL